MTSTRISILTCALAVASSIAATAAAWAQSCHDGWDLDFSARGINGVVWDLAVFDDGAGPALYASGRFSSAGGVPVSSLAKWDGQHWSDVGGGLTDQDDVGWVPAMQVWDDGRGPALYVGGRFDLAGNRPVNNVARWDGHSWESLGEGTDAWAMSFGLFDDGRGEALYVGGGFHQAGGQDASLIARWDGANWEPLGQGLTNSHPNFGAMTMTVFDDGHGPMLYVGGDFYDIDRKGATDIFNAAYLARWNGHAWFNVPQANLRHRGGGGSAHVDQLMVFDGGYGPALYLTGDFQRGYSDFRDATFLHWDGRHWSSNGQGSTVPLFFYAGGVNHPDAMTIFDDGDGPALWVGGGSVRVPERGGATNTTVFKWNGRYYTALHSYPDPWVYKMVEFDDGTGPALYVGGDISRIYFPSGEPAPAQNIARWYPTRLSLTHTHLRAGQRAIFSAKCASPEQPVVFAYSTTGMGSYYISQLGITIDLDQPHLLGQAIADNDGKAAIARTLPPNSSGRTVYLQSAQSDRKSLVIQTTIE